MRATVVAVSDAAGTSPAVGERSRRGGRFARLRRLPPVAAAIAVPSLIALGLCCYQYSTPNLLFSVYDGDDGVYFGAAMRLSDGLFPYKDFVIVHPPGIAVLLLPLAAVGHLFGTRVGFAAARCLTVAVVTANVVLVGLLVRHRGAFAAFAAGLFLACFPVAVAADNTLLLEPYLAFFCLLGLLLAFPKGQLATGRRLIGAGAAFGLASTVKIWAVFPLLAIGAYLLFRHREAIGRFAFGLVVALAVFAGPFAAAAPAAFFRDVVASQWLRGRRGTPTAPPGDRLLQLTGIGGWGPNLAASVGVLAGVALVALLGAYFVCVRGHSSLEFALASGAAVAVAAEFISREFYAYYAYFPAVFIAPLCALALSSIVWRFREGLARRPSVDPRLRRALGRLPWAAAVVAAALAVPANASYASQYLASSGINNPAPVIDAAIPPGACVLSVDVVYALVSDRFTSPPGCPTLDDSYGTWIALNDGSPPASPPFSPALVSQWTSWLEQANYLIYRQTNVKIPLTPALVAYVDAHYRLVASGQYFQVFRHTP